MAGTERRVLRWAGSPSKSVEILRLHKQGLPLHQIAKEMSRSWWTVKALLRPTVATEERLNSPGTSRFR
jgi:DNA-binding NarL/FixJ family response regulator